MEDTLGPDQDANTSPKPAHLQRSASSKQMSEHKENIGSNMEKKVATESGSDFKSSDLDSRESIN